MQKKNSRKKIFLFLTALVSVILFSPVFNLSAADYNLLAPLPGLNTFNPGSMGTPGAGDLGAYLSKIIPLFIGICAILAVVMIVIGGIEYMTNEIVSNKEEGKKKIRNAIAGLLLALAAWLILYTINPKILDVDLSSVVQQVVEINIHDSVPQPTPPPQANGQPGKYTCGVGPGDPITAMGNTVTLPSYVHMNFPECTTVGQGSGCLSTRGLNLSYLEMVHAKCPNADLGLNGATECWHHGGGYGSTTHGPESATIDLQANSALNACLSEGKPLINPMRYPVPHTGLFYFEGNHWHIGR